MEAPRQFNWIFIDMDSFFASVEQHLRPELRGRMVGVIPVQSEGTCVIAASADAKRRGVKAGTRAVDARQLCPGIVLVKARPAVYVKVHHALIRSVDRCAPVDKVYSIDEWSIRLLGEERRAQRAIELGRAIKREMLADFSPWLTCSIGVAATRLLAKLASDMHKPDGLVTLATDELPQRLEHLKLTDFPGIADGTLRKLHSAGVYTVRELWELSRHDSRRIWGSVQGESWWAGFHGHDEPEQTTHRHTIMHAHRLPPEFRNDTGARGILVRLLCRGAARLRCHQYVTHRLHVSVSDYESRGWDAQSPLGGTQDTLTILRHFGELWERRPWATGGRSPIREFAQVSMTLSELAPLASTTELLFPQEQQLRRLSHAIDQLNRRWGANAVYPGSMHNFRHQMDDKIAFGRIPEVEMTT